MLSLAELRRAVRLLDEACAGARLERVIQPDRERVVLVLHRAGQGATPLLLSAHPETARLGLLTAKPPAPPTPPAFAQLLRARLRGGRLSGAEIRDDDRQAALRFETPEGAFVLLLSILGPRSNLYLLDDQDRLVGALRPLARTRSELAPGAAWRSPAGRPPHTGEDRFAAVSDREFFAAIETSYAEQEAERSRSALLGRLERALRRAADALDRKARALDRDAGAAQDAELARRHGELLKNVLGEVRPRASEVEARDPATGESVRIPLDPSLSAAGNLDALFRRARKAERRALRAEKERGVLAERREALAALRAELDERAMAPDAEAALGAFAERPEMARLLARHAPAAPRRTEKPRATVRLAGREVPRRLLPRRYRSRDGLEIWVGRSDEGNDLLTTRLARGQDLFFHLDASPGSHVVLRTEGRPDPPGEAVLEACELAVHFSPHRKAGRMDVLVAPIKDVRKPKGAKPGLVHVRGGRVVRLRRDPRRLERVLAARLDETES